MLNTPWWVWVALVNLLVVVWVAVDLLDEMHPPPQASRGIHLAVRAIAVGCCLVLGVLLPIAVYLSERARRAQRASSCPSVCADASGEASRPRPLQEVAP